MKHIENSFVGAAGLKIYYQAWLPDTKPKAILQLAHGINEHSGRYMNVVNEVLLKGFAVYANDHIGHGKSEGPRSFVCCFDQFVEDEKTFNELIKKEHPGLPVFLLGHSMGSVIGLRFATKYSDLIKGLVLSGCGTRTGGDVSGFIKAMAKILSKLTPKLVVSVGDLSHFLSHDPKEVEAYRTDPLVFLKGVSARLGAELMRCFSENMTLAPTLKVPLLYQCGGEDKLVFGGKELSEKFVLADKTIKIYDGLWHEVFSESEELRSKPLADLGAWLENHL
jgi:acylglycerol lipase